jgi:peptide subunit release factor 1 (eRF1)
MTLATPVLAPTPRIAPPRILTVVLDHVRARLFAVTDSEVTEVADLRSGPARGGKFHADRRGSPGVGEQAYHRRVEEEEHRHFAAVVVAVTAQLAKRPKDGLLVAGPGPLATVFRRFLAPALDARVIGMEQLNPAEVTPAVVASITREAARHHRHVVEQQVVATIAEGLGTGLATNGVRETLRALAQRQVRALVVPTHARGEGFRCLGSGRLVLAATDCRGEGAARPVADVIQSAARDAVLQGAEVIAIHDPMVAKTIDGLAALLRYR